MPHPLDPVELVQIRALVLFRDACQQQLMETDDDYTRGCCEGGIERATELIEQLFDQWWARNGCSQHVH